MLSLGEVSAGKLVATPGMPSYATDIFTQTEAPAWHGSATDHFFLAADKMDFFTSMVAV